MALLLAFDWLIRTHRILELPARRSPRLPANHPRVRRRDSGSWTRRGRHTRSVSWGPQFRRSSLTNTARSCTASKRHPRRSLQARVRRAYVGRDQGQCVATSCSRQLVACLCAFPFVFQNLLSCQNNTSGSVPSFFPSEISNILHRVIDQFDK
jgi:hypothetical protein